MTQQGEQMRLTAALRRWLEQNEWQDEVEVDEERMTSRLATRYVIDNQPHRLFLEINEPLHRLVVYLYSPFNVPPERAGEVARLLNHFNQTTVLATVSCGDDGEPRPVQYKSAIDVEGGELVAEQISTLLSAAAFAAESYAKSILAVALAETPAGEAWERFVAEQEA